MVGGGECVLTAIPDTVSPYPCILCPVYRLRPYYLFCLSGVLRKPTFFPEYHDALTITNSS